MIKPFVVLLFMLILMVFSVGLHYTNFSYEKTTGSMQYVTTLTKMAPLSLSIAYDESKYNSTYPEMQGLGRMDFIYEQ